MALSDDRKHGANLVGRRRGPAERPQRSRFLIEPAVFTYLIVPPAFVLALVLQHYKLIATHTISLWLTVFLAVVLANRLAQVAFLRKRNMFSQQLQLVANAASVTTVIYLTGWGPVLIAGYLFGVLDIISMNGYRIWKSALAWSFLGVAIGQTMIGLSWAPSFLSDGDAQAVGVMSAFIMGFIVRMAAAIAENRDLAEASLRSSEQSLRHSERRFRSLVQYSTDTTLVVDPEGRITYASPSAEALFGAPVDQLLAKEVMQFLSPDDADRARWSIATYVPHSGRATAPLEFSVIGATGRTRDVEAVVTDLRNEAAVGGWVVNIRDITDRTAAEALLVHQAQHDALTGLPNRTVILQQADRMLLRSAEAEKEPSIFFIDLDNFKDVNDGLGHEVGDEVLRVIAQRLSAQLRSGEIIGRMGGDEFVVLSELTDGSESAAAIAKRLCKALTDPIRVLGDDGPLIQVTVSIGIAQGRRESANELLRDADIALYQAKLAGRDCWVSFVPEMKSTALRSLQLRSELDAAIEEGQFHLLYQPMFDIGQEKIGGVEALIRWEHPTQGVVSPDQFIPVLEQTGRIIEVGRWVLDEACRQGALWCSKGHRIGVAVNASARQLEDAAFFEDVTTTLSKWGFPPHLLVIEITETSLMHASELANQHLVDLKRRGVRVAIDDFGTGYSSLSYLLQFSVDALKVDRSFVGAISTSPHAAAVVRTVLQLGKALDLDVIAEGIEDTEQLGFLRSEGCRWGQGFLLARPLDPSVVEGMLDSGMEWKQTSKHGQMQRLASSGS